MTSYRFAFSSLAELKQATLHYEEKENGLGAAFLDEVDGTIARILANPRAWHPLSPRTRRCRTHRFPFGVIYQIRSTEILIVSVMDLRRDPKSWKTSALG
jgi:plasmid stabilization system protein ParE